MGINSIDAEDDQFAYRYDTQLLIDRRDKDLDEDEISKRLYYTYDEYMEHLSYYEKYVEENDNLTAVYADHLDYPELTIRVRCKECVIITRSCEPKMNLVVSEPYICDLFEQYISRELLGR